MIGATSLLPGFRRCAPGIQRITAGRDAMTTNIHQTVQIGDLIVAAFDVAAKYSTDSREISRLATRAVIRMLRNPRKTSPPGWAEQDAGR